jgi:hypothetical protein
MNLLGFPYSVTVPTPTNVEKVDVAAMDPIVFSLNWNRAEKLAQVQGWHLVMRPAASHPYQVWDGIGAVMDFKSLSELTTWLKTYTPGYSS